MPRNKRMPHAAARAAGHAGRFAPMKLLRFLKEPPLPFAAVIWACALALSGGSIAAVVIGGGRGWTYFLYASAALFLGYGVYLAVRLTPRMRENISARVHRHAFTGRFADDYAFRTVFFAAFSFAVNAGYAAVHAVLAVLRHSLWFGALAGYYILLTLLRGGVLLSGRRAQRRAAGEAARLMKDKWRIFCGSGAALLLLDGALTVFVTQTIFFGRPQVPSLIMAIASAAYTFYRIVFCIYQTVRVRREGDPVLQALRNISLANALVALFALQIALIAVNGGTSPAMHILNIVMGALVCTATVALGCFMLVRGCLVLRRMKASSAPAGE